MSLNPQSSPRSLKRPTRKSPTQRTLKRVTHLNRRLLLKLLQMSCSWPRSGWRQSCFCEITTNRHPGILSAPTPLTGGRRWQMYTKNSGASATNVAWSTDGQRLAIANGLIVRLYNFQEETPEFDAVLAGHTDTVTAVRFNAAGDRLATASLDGTVRVWDAEGSERFVYREHEDAVQDVSFHPDGLRLASASFDGTVRIWSIDGKPVAVLRDHEAPLTPLPGTPMAHCLHPVVRTKPFAIGMTKAWRGPSSSTYRAPSGRWLGTPMDRNCCPAILASKPRLTAKTMSPT